MAITECYRTARACAARRLLSLPTRGGGQPTDKLWLPYPELPVMGLMGGEGWVELSHAGSHGGRAWSV